MARSGWMHPVIYHNLHEHYAESLYLHFINATGREGEEMKKQFLYTEQI